MKTMMKAICGPGLMFHTEEKAPVAAAAEDIKHSMIFKNCDKCRGIGILAYEGEPTRLERVLARIAGWDAVIVGLVAFIAGFFACAAMAFFMV